jgi:prefoldin subunit 5
LRVDRLQRNLRGLQRDVRRLQRDMRRLQRDVRRLQRDVRRLQRDVRRLQRDVRRLQRDVRRLQRDPGERDQSFAEIESKILTIRRLSRRRPGQQRSFFAISPNPPPVWMKTGFALGRIPPLRIVASMPVKPLAVYVGSSKTPSLRASSRSVSKASG